MVRNRKTCIEHPCSIHVLADYLPFSEVLFEISISSHHSGANRITKKCAFHASRLSYYFIFSLLAQMVVTISKFLTSIRCEVRIVRTYFHHCLLIVRAPSLRAYLGSYVPYVLGRPTHSYTHDGDISSSPCGTDTGYNPLQ